ncbi:BGTF surface domain-containing protein [Halobacterium sp. CBA1126]|uniref:DUF7282 domain-containing protein n=1 Tax=Halobacterium sp. CBA1126 TaxID=2668074 RepID=UPI0012FAB2F2|nr:BGTF surface domain-containing protein [Halobacterium sp. CBA1126]MUV61428.1 hypothetical protein [Halobacterium sp. CBA1126]
MAHTRSAPVVAALVVAAVLAGVAPGAAQQESASVSGSDVVRGETSIISFSHSAPANLTITGGGFETVVELDGSGSGSLELDTYATTGDTASDFIEGPGTPHLKGEPLSEAIKPGTYDLLVTIDGDVEATGEFTVSPNGEVTSESGALSGETELADTGVGSIQTHEEIGRGNDNVVVGDYAAFVVDENDSGYGAPFSGALTMDDLDREGFEMRVRELDPEPNTDRETYTAEDLEVIGEFGAAGSEFGVLWNTSGVDLNPGSNHTYEFELSVNASENPLLAEDETFAVERVTVVEPSVGISADPSFTLPPWESNEMVVSGKSNLLPGTSLEVRALQKPPNSYLWKSVVEVSRDGSFETTFDFSPAERPASFPLYVDEYRQATEHTVELTVANASLLFPSQVVQNGSVTVERVTMSRTGFLELTADNETIGTAGPLSQMTNGSVDVTLNESLDGPTNVTARAVVDGNGNGELDADDPAYESSGSPVAETALVEPSTPAEPTTTAANETQAPTTTEVSLQVNEEPPLAPVASNDNSSGGFVPLSPATTLAAVVAALLLAARRGPDRL